MNARVYVLLAVLTLAAGYSDAVSFFGLGVFTANMTGNVVLLAGALASPLLPVAAAKIPLMLTAVSLVCFSGGAALAAYVLRGETGRPPIRTAAVMTTVVLLLAVAAALFSREAGARFMPLCVALLSTVAGMQSVVAARAGVPGITTIVVTGAMTTAILDLFGTAPVAAGRRHSVPYLAELAIYLGGAGLGACGLGLLGSHAFWPAVAVVALLIPVL